MSKKKIISFASLILSDCATILASFILAYLIRSEILPLINPSLLERPVFIDVYLRRFYMLSVWIVVFLYERLYTRRYSFWDETRYLFKSTTIAFSFTMIAVFITGINVGNPRTIAIIPPPTMRNGSYFNLGLLRLRLAMTLFNPPVLVIGILGFDIV